MSPYQPLIPDQIASHARWNPDKPALIFEDQVLTWSEYEQATRRFAAGLGALGLSPGDRVAFVAANSVELAIGLIGVIRAGMAVVPLNVTISDHDMQRMFADSGAAAIFVTPDHADRVARLLQDKPVVPPDARIALQPAAGWRSLNEFLTAGADKPHGTVDQNISPEAAFNIIYSSGTTSVPKGIVHTQAGRLEFCTGLALEMRVHRNTVALCSLGLYSNISWSFFLCTLYMGGTVVLMRKFEPVECLRLTQTYRVTFTVMVPLQFQTLLDSADTAAFDVSSLELVMSCGSPLSIALKQRMDSALQCRVMELYGLTEGFATILAPEESAGRPGSVGKPMVGMDMRLVDADGGDVPRGSDGEIWGTSAALMTGYHNNPTATAEAIYTDAQGRRWMKTGDVGRLDDDGYLYIVGRIKEMILSGGQNIYPTDLEAVLTEHEQVIEAAVVGAPHDKWGETPVAFVVTAPGAPCSAIDLLDWANARLGKRQRIAAVHFLDELPRNANGKVLRVKLKADCKNMSPQ